MIARNFWNSQAEWSNATFGDESVRGPIGPLKHLKKEVEEATEEAFKLKDYKLLRKDTQVEATIPILQEEIVDCQFLVFDAARRAGLTFDQFFDLCFDKLEKNKKRKWDKPTSDGPVEHIRDVCSHGNSVPDPDCGCGT